LPGQFIGGPAIFCGKVFGAPEKSVMAAATAKIAHAVPGQ